MSDLGFSGAPSLDFARDLLGQDFTRPWSMQDWRGEFRAGALQNNLPFVQSGLLSASRSAFGAGTAQLANAFGSNPFSNLNSAHPQPVIQSGGLTINVAFDTSVASAPVGFTTAVNAAVTYLESQFSDPITINIHVGWGEIAEGLGGPADPGTPLSPGALGQSLTNLFGFTYADVRAALLGDATSADDNTANATLGTIDPTSGGTFLVSVAEARALTLYTASNAQVDGYVGFDSTAAFDFDNSNGVSAGHYDFYDVVLHEFTEVMGRQMANGGSNQYEALDLFHYSAPGTPIFSAATAGYFSIDGGTTNLNSFNTNPGGDSGDWAASAGNDSFLAFSGPGVVNAVSVNDIREMDILGYDRVAAGSSPDLTVNTLVFSNSTLSYHVNNVGSATAGASTAGIYLSTDSTITTADTRINTHATPSLAAGATDIENLVLSLPTNRVPGTYYIGVIADYTGAVAESNEANNASAATPIILGDNNANTLNGPATSIKLFALGGTDTITMGATLASNDQVDGGLGTDTVTLAGNYSAGVVFAATTMINVEILNLTAGFSYKLTTNNSTVAAGQLLKIDGSALGAADVLTFSGAAETDGRFNILGGAAADQLTGGTGDDAFSAGLGNDMLTLSSGGNDTAGGGDGNDTFVMGAAFTSSDRVDGGVGTDTVTLAGNYTAGVNFAGATMINVEAINLTAGFSYSLTTNDTTVAAGQTLRVDGSTLGAADVLVFVGQHELDGRFNILGGASADKLTGGAGNDSYAGGLGNDTLTLSFGGNDTAGGGDGNDTFSMGAAFTASDRLDGGAGNDVVMLAGNYGAGVTFSATTMINIETLKVTAGNNYKLTTSDTTVGAGLTFKVDASVLGAGNTLNFNGAAELDGKFNIKGGAGGDTLGGGAGGDVFNGGGGADLITGNGGNDHFIYGAVTDSTSVNYDTIAGVSFGANRFDLTFAITGIDTALTGGPLNTASFDSDLTSVLTGHLNASHAMLFTANSGTLSGQTFLVIDGNGVAGYQANADLVIHLTAQTGTLVTGDFI